MSEELRKVALHHAMIVVGDMPDVTILQVAERFYDFLSADSRLYPIQIPMGLTKMDMRKIFDNAFKSTDFNQPARRVTMAKTKSKPKKEAKKPVTSAKKLAKKKDAKK